MHTFQIDVVKMSRQKKFVANSSRISGCSKGLLILIFLTNHANFRILYTQAEPFPKAFKMLFHLRISISGSRGYEEYLNSIEHMFLLQHYYLK